MNLNPFSKKYRLAFICVFATQILPNYAYSLDKEPTFLACTCNISKNTKKDGSNVTNAKLCVQTKDDSARWCRVTVHCLSSNVGPGCKARNTVKTLSGSATPISFGAKLNANQNAASQNITSSFLQLFKQHIGTSETKRYSDDQAKLQKSFEANLPLIYYCASFFGKKEPLKSNILSNNKSFGCTVTQNARWLVVTSRIGKKSHSFHVAP